MPKRIQIIKQIISSSANDVKNYFKPTMIYKPYTPKVIGNKLPAEQKEKWRY